MLIEVLITLLLGPLPGRPALPAAAAELGACRVPPPVECLNLTYRACERRGGVWLGPDSHCPKPPAG